MGVVGFTSTVHTSCVGLTRIGLVESSQCSSEANQQEVSSSSDNGYPPMPIITSWQKGQRLGKGIFGTVYEGIAGIGRGVLLDVPDTLSPEARDFILRCLKANANERPTAGELLNHPFVRRPLMSSSGSVSVSPQLVGRA